MKKRVWAALAIIVLGAAAVWKWRSGGEAGPTFESVRVEKGDIEVTVSATGVVQPQNRVEIKPPIAGRAEEILVREGETARKGQVLAWMSSIERAALLDAARAKGPEELAHWEDLYKPTPLIAPLSGVIISRDFEPGQTVTAQDPVLVMSNRLIVKAQVDETDIGRAKVGQKALITLDAYPREPVPARVDHIAYEAATVNNVTIYEVEVVPEHVPDFMRSGMTANVTFMIAAKRGVLLLPAEAVQQGDDGSFVRVPSAKEGETRRQEVRTGLSDVKNIEILEGLGEGDTVLVASFRLPSSGGGGNSPFSPFGGRRSGGRQGGGQSGGGQRGGGR
jgi:membrane fusion protein, macrolide-specific efflux system